MWLPSLQKYLGYSIREPKCKMEPDNESNQCSVAMKKDVITIGHLS